MIREIILRGTSYERGLQHGLLLGPQIREFLADNRARINSIRTVPLSDEEIDHVLNSYGPVIAAELPEIAQELQGLAEGADISYKDALLLQLRMELINMQATDEAEGDCSTIAIHQNNQRISGQTIDLPGDLTDLGYVFRSRTDAPQDPEILMYSFAGLLGYMGLNSAGLSININMVLSANWQPGIPPYLLVRHMLNKRSVNECKQELLRIKAGSSRSFILSDQEQLVNAELTGTHISFLNDNCLLHTNHFLHEQCKEEDIMHFLFRNSSIKRLELLKQLLPKNLESVTPELLFDILSDHTLYPVGICAHDENNIRRSATVAAVVMQPVLYEMQVRKGYPCQASTFMYTHATAEPLHPATINAPF